jgi:hypothetical protein
MVSVVQSDRQARALAAWGDDLRQQGQRLAKQLAFLLGRLAETEEHLAEAFARRALSAPHRVEELWHWAWLAHAEAERLRSKQAHLRQAILPRWFHS